MAMVRIPAWKAFLYVEVYRVIEWRDGCVYRTKKIGYGLSSRAKKADEIHVSMDVKREDEWLEFELME